MWRVSGVLALALAALSQKLEISTQDQQVWIVWPDGKRERVTHGPENANAPAWSADARRIAWFRYCPGVNQCEPALVIGDRAGKPLQEFSLAERKDWKGCYSVMGIDFLDGGRMGIRCHLNPSLLEYTVLDGAGRPVENWLGGSFAWSPDRRRMAQSGSVPHFSPPFAHSDYLQIDRRTVYPRAAVGAKEPSLVQESGALYRGVHEFQSRLAWSPDSRRVALVDRVYDWVPVEDAPTDAGERNSRTAIAVADGEGASSTAPAAAGCGWESQIVWTGAAAFELRCGEATYRFALDKTGRLSRREN